MVVESRDKVLISCFIFVRVISIVIDIRFIDDFSVFFVIFIAKGVYLKMKSYYIKLYKDY